ncbi:OmpA family protein [Ruminococcus sp.]|uniref:OmpA family protein n=1 Tax=Ruminococcus sp. TaxID=41978 RepID=UPI00388D3C8E
MKNCKGSKMALRLTAILGALVLSAAALTACSGKKETPTEAQPVTQAPTQAPTQAETESPKLSFSNVDINYDMPTTAPIEVPTAGKLTFSNIDIDFGKFENKDYGAQVNPNSGAITLDSSVLFASDSYELSDNGKTKLKSFLDDYCAETIHNGDNKNKIKKIAVEGHTDTDGSYEYNKTLSENRAKAVIDFAVQEHPELKDYLYAVGKSYDEPVYNDDGTVNKEKSRRVVFIPES